MENSPVEGFPLVLQAPLHARTKIVWEVGVPFLPSGGITSAICSWGAGGLHPELVRENSW